MIHRLIQRRRLIRQSRRFGPRRFPVIERLTNHDPQLDDLARDYAVMGVQTDEKGLR